MIENKPQINADERRFIVHFPEQSVEFLHGKKINNSPQRVQSAGIFKIFFEKTLTLRRRTQITRIGRIFTDRRASASTVTPVDCVHTYASALAYVDVYSPNKKERLLPPPLLRTVRESFPSY
ncbi:MAG: hypothetical protein V1854_07655, partial [Methanobacteriota archaeon]